MMKNTLGGLLLGLILGLIGIEEAYRHGQRKLLAERQGHPYWLRKTATRLTQARCWEAVQDQIDNMTAVHSREYNAITEMAVQRLMELDEQQRAIQQRVVEQQRHTLGVRMAPSWMAAVERKGRASTEARRRLWARLPLVDVVKDALQGRDVLPRVRKDQHHERRA